MIIHIKLYQVLKKSVDNDISSDTNNAENKRKVFEGLVYAVWIESLNSSMVNSMFNIVKTYLLEFESDENKKVPKNYEDNISNIALFAVV